MLTIKNKFKDLLNLAANNGSCITKTSMYLYEDENMSILEGMKKHANEGWACWFLIKVGEKMNKEIRKIFLDMITTEMTAFQLYIHCKSLTDKEDELLRLKFKGKLPTAEKELREGIVSRANND